MKVLVETTEWEGIEYPAPNHTYLIDDRGRLLAYKPRHTGSAQWLKRPSAKFDRARRKFTTQAYKEAEWH